MFAAYSVYMILRYFYAHCSHGPHLLLWTKRTNITRSTSIQQEDIHLLPCSKINKFNTKYTENKCRIGTLHACEILQSKFRG